MTQCQRTIHEVEGAVLQLHLDAAHGLLGHRDVQQAQVHAARRPEHATHADYSVPQHQWPVSKLVSCTRRLNSRSKGISKHANVLRGSSEYAIWPAAPETTTLSGADIVKEGEGEKKLGEGEEGGGEACAGSGQFRSELPVAMAV